MCCVDPVGISNLGFLRFILVELLLDWLESAVGDGNAVWILVVPMCWVLSSILSDFWLIL